MDGLRVVSVVADPAVYAQAYDVVANATLTEIRASTTGPSTQQTALPQDLVGPSRLVVGPTQRGILKDVLQPGIYYVNPRLMKVMREQAEVFGCLLGDLSPGDIGTQSLGVTKSRA